MTFEKCKGRIITRIKKDPFLYSCYDTKIISDISSFLKSGYDPEGDILIIEKFYPRRSYETYFRENIPFGSYKYYLERTDYLKSMSIPIGMLLVVWDVTPSLKTVFENRAYIISALNFLEHLKNNHTILDIVERIPQ